MTSRLRFDPRACLTKATCLEFQHKAKHLPNSLSWAFPCGSCLEGRARMMDGWTPEPDRQPSHISKIEPWHFNPKRIDRNNPSHCPCGAKLSTSASYYGTGLCMKCYRKSRRPPRQCIAITNGKRCINVSRRRGLCQRHIRESKDATAATSLPGSVRLGSTGD